MLAKTLSAALEGLDASLVEVEVDIAGGLPAVTVVGLPDAAVKESRERVKSAVVNSGYRFPPRRVTINLAPADIRKEGPVYDLAIALGLLAAGGQVELVRAAEFLVLGELALDGQVRPVRGALSAPRRWGSSPASWSWSAGASRSPRSCARPRGVRPTWPTSGARPARSGP